MPAMTAGSKEKPTTPQRLRRGGLLLALGLTGGRALRGARSLRGDLLLVVEHLVAVLLALHPRDDQSLDLGRALEQLVDLRVAEELLQRAVGRLGVRAH